LYTASHVAAGAAIGISLKKPATAFALGLLSHIVLDAVPHHDEKSLAGALTIGGLSVFIALYIGTRCGLKSPAFWGAIGGGLPDVENVLNYFHVFGPGWYTVFPCHTGLLPHNSAPAPWGVVWPVAVMLLSGWVIWRKLRGEPGDLFVLFRRQSIGRHHRS